jgi:hypothetical protein
MNAITDAITTSTTILLQRLIALFPSSLFVYASTVPLDLSFSVLNVGAALQPAGEIEAFFDNLEKLGSSPEREVLRRVFSSHGMELTGPPLPIA